MAKYVLVVQQNLLYRRFLTGVLGELGCLATVTDNLKEAEAYLSQFTFDAVISGSAYQAERKKTRKFAGWKELHERTRRCNPMPTFILFTAAPLEALGVDSETPPVHYVMKDEPKKAREKLDVLLR